MKEIKTFDECLEISKGEGNRHLMLGNGFSRALFNDIFNYERLAEKVKKREIQSLFDKMKTTDFEYVMRELFNSLVVIDVFEAEGKKSKIHEEISEYYNILKYALIRVISDSHPESPKHIKENEYNSCYEFLKHFESGKKYSFNYDLLLYWVYMHFRSKDKIKNNNRVLKSDDGFRKDDEEIVSWEIGAEIDQNVYYLHGAMHIFKDRLSKIEKFTWKNTNMKIKTQVTQAINNGKFPVFISEGVQEHKEKRIKENGYLSRGLSSIKSIGGSLFIFGHSLRDEDDHVFNLINQSNIKKVFISLFGEQNSKENQKIIAKVNGWREQKFIWKSRNKDRGLKEYIFYNAQSAKVWDRQT